MARPINRIKRLPESEDVRKQRDLEDIGQALSRHKTAVLEAIELVQGLHDRGILPLLNSLVAEGDKVLAIAVKELNRPQNARILENFVQLALLVGSLDLERLKPMLDSVNAGLQEAATGRASENRESLMSLFKTLRDPDVQRALSVLISFLKGMGREGDRTSSGWDGL